MIYPMIDRTVVRNKAYPRSNFSIRERHNERKNEVYSNPDIVLERSSLKISVLKAVKAHIRKSSIDCWKKE